MKIKEELVWYEISSCQLVILQKILCMEIDQKKLYLPRSPLHPNQYNTVAAATCSLKTFSLVYFTLFKDWNSSDYFNLICAMELGLVRCAESSELVENVGWVREREIICYVWNLIKLK